MDDFEFSSLSDKDQMSVQRNPSFHLSQGCIAGLDDAPKLVFLKNFPFSVPSGDFIKKCDLWVFINNV